MIKKKQLEFIKILNKDLIYNNILSFFLFFSILITSFLIIVITYKTRISTNEYIKIQLEKNIEN